MSNSISKDYIFKQDEAGEMQFIGDFNNFYKDEQDPWDQSANGESAGYYHTSRRRVAQQLKYQKAEHVLEIGCGIGYACHHMYQHHNAQYEGWDISQIAIDKAKRKFPTFTFCTKDITKPDLEHDKTFDVVILNQLLWYILPNLDQVMKNCFDLVSNNGQVIISNAFAREQKFGNEYIDGFQGAFVYFSNLKNLGPLVKAEFNDEGHRNLDGFFVLSKQSSHQS